MSARPWYKRYPSDFIGGTLDLSFEAKGAYSILLDLMYDKGRGVIPDDSAWIARVLGCSTRKWNQLREQLIEAGKIEVREGEIVNAWRLPISGSRRSLIPSWARRLVVERDGYCCVYCGGTEGPFHIDHRTPVRLGGADVPENLVVACAPCNLSKGAKTMEEWLNAR